MIHSLHICCFYQEVKLFFSMSVVLINEGFLLFYRYMVQLKAKVDRKEDSYVLGLSDFVDCSPSLINGTIHIRLPIGITISDMKMSLRVFDRG